MVELRETTLEEWIKQELTADLETELSKHKERIKALFQLTPSGEILIRRLSNLTAKQKILLYMIGKVYADFVKYTDGSTVTNKELLDALGIAEGTVKYTLHDLRNNGIIISRDGVHQIKIEQIGIVLNTYFGGDNEP